MKKIPLLNLVINYISARSAPQLLSIKDECTFLVLDFLIVVLCNSLVNTLFDAFSFLIAPLEVDLSASEWIFFQKIYRPLMQVHVDVHHISDF